MGLPRWLNGKEAGNARDTNSIPGSGRSPEGENGNRLQYPYLGNPMVKGAWWVTVHGVAESDVTEHDTRNSILGPNREAPDNLVSEIFTPKV